MKSIKKLISIVLSVILIAAIFAGCAGNTDKTTTAKSAASESTAAAQDAKVLKLGFDAEFAPMGFKENGEYVGFDLDVAKEAAAIMGYELELIPITWGAKDTELEAGTINCIWSGFTMHVDDRDNQYTWTDAYMNNTQVVCVAADSKISSLADLKGKIIGAQEDSSALAAVDHTPSVKNSVATVQQFADYETALNNLKIGAIDALAIDSTVINYKITKGDSSIKILDEKLSNEEFGIAFLKGNTELRDKVQTALNTLASNGKLAEISIKWFGSDITTVGK